MKKVIVFLSLALFVVACSDSSSDQNSGDAPPPKSMVGDDANAEPAADPKGIGEIKNVELNDPLDQTMVDAGKGIYEMKCAACHKLTGQRVVGPGWAGITTKRTPEWIMNMTLNVDVMLEKDPAARELLKECLVRMPNQNLTKDDARAVLEYMYANDASGE